MLYIDNEYRVRSQFGELVKAMIVSDKKKGLSKFEEYTKVLVDNVNQTFERNPEQVDASSTLKPYIKDADSGKTMHDTEGWKTLETSIRIIQKIIEAVGTDLYQFELQSILDVIVRSRDHINRFVREISYHVINAIFETSILIFEEG